MTAAQKRRLREQRRRRRDRDREDRRKFKKKDFHHKFEDEERNVAVVRNEAENGTTSGILNINVQVPIQIGANAQNILDSENVSTTVI